MEVITLENFVEPLYPIIRKELYDENIIKRMLSDDHFSLEDRKLMSIYYKNKKNAGETQTIYTYGQGCELYKLGRLFPENNIGIANWSWIMRNPLAEKYYWDVDVANAHYKIALKFCEKYKISSDQIKNYCDNREDILKMVCPTNRDKAKMEFLRILYGGDIKLYSSNIDEIEGNLTNEGILYLKSLQNEIQTLMLYIWNENENLHHIKTGKEKIQISKKSNPKASLMSLIFQTEERKILMCLEAFLRLNGRYMGVFIHDGGYIEKLEGELQFPKILLDQGAETIKRLLGYDVKLEQKQITHNYTIKSTNLNDYEAKKILFEEKNALVGATFVLTHSDGYVEFKSEKDAKIIFGNWIVKAWNNEKNKIMETSFISEYIKDNKRINYERLDFDPDPNFNNKNIYNLFRGFEAEKYKKNYVKEELNFRLEKIQRIKTHLNFLTSGHSDYLLKWLAFIIQHPNQRTNVSILLRDEGDLLNEGGGTGKNQFFERFAEKIIGEKYSLFIDDNNDLYDKFNSLFEGKLFVFVDEAYGGANHKNADTLKAKITRKKMNVNKKSIAQYIVNDLANYIFCSNNKNPIPIKKGDRRFAVFDVNPEMRGNKQYFLDLIADLENDEVIECLYHYLKYDLETFKNAFEVCEEIPDTAAYREIKSLNAPQHIKFLIHLLNKGTLREKVNSREFYETYCKWCKKYRAGKEDEILTETAFAVLLKKNSDNVITMSNDIKDYSLNGSEPEKRRDSSGMKYYFNINKLVEGLKKIKILDKDFEFIKSVDLYEDDEDDE